MWEGILRRGDPLPKHPCPLILLPVARSLQCQCNVDLIFRVLYAVVRTCSYAGIRVNYFGYNYRILGHIGLGLGFGSELMLGF